MLATVQADGLAAYGAPVFLRWGDNAVPEDRRPKPNPADILEHVDSLVLNDPKMEPTASLMLRLTRWAGCRVSELVSMPVDCLRHNGNGYWLTYYTPKTKNHRSLPLPDDLAGLLRKQQDLVRSDFGPDTTVLFPSPGSNKTTRVAVLWRAGGFRKHVSAAFRRNGIEFSTITGEKVTGGEIHRYRHTIGTALLNNGWTQREVQEFLGHASPTMTAHYAAILDDTLNVKAREFRDSQQAADSPSGTEVVDPKVERMRARFAYELPNGGCTLPANQSCETRENPCTGCAFFEPGDQTVREVHVRHRQRLKVHIAQATDPREIELNQRALDEVEAVLRETEGVGDDGPE